MVPESRHFSHSEQGDQSPSLERIKDKLRAHLARRKHRDRRPAPQHDSLQEHVDTSTTIAPPDTLSKLSKLRKRLTSRKILSMWQQDLTLEGAQDTEVMCDVCAQQYQVTVCRGGQNSQLSHAANHSSVAKIVLVGACRR